MINKYDRLYSLHYSIINTHTSATYVENLPLLCFALLMVSVCVIDIAGDWGVLLCSPGYTWVKNPSSLLNVGIIVVSHQT